MKSQVIEPCLNMEELSIKLFMERQSDDRFNYARKKNNDAKSAARNRLVSLFSPRNFPKGLSILTMPGYGWYFERALLGSRESGRRMRGSQRPRRTYICSIEHDEAIFRAALANMPGIRSGSHTAIKLPPAPYSTATYRSYAIQRFHRCQFRDLASYYIVNTQHSFDAAWLDFCGPLSFDMLILIQQFWQVSVRKILAITYMKSRGTKLSNTLIQSSPESFLEGTLVDDVQYGQMRQITMEKPCYVPGDGPIELPGSESDE